MSYEVISEPFLGRLPSLGGFGARRQMVVVKHSDGTTGTMLATDVKKDQKAQKAVPAVPVSEQEAK